MSTERFVDAARKALRTYLEKPEEAYPSDAHVDEDLESEQCLRDLLADLMHWSEYTKVPFDEALARAQRHFLTERAEHAEDEFVGEIEKRI